MRCHCDLDAAFLCQEFLLSMIWHHFVAKQSKVSIFLLHVIVNTTMSSTIGAIIMIFNIIFADKNHSKCHVHHSQQPINCNCPFRALIVINIITTWSGKIMMLSLVLMMVLSSSGLFSAKLFLNRLRSIWEVRRLKVTDWSGGQWTEANKLSPIPSTAVRLATGSSLAWL